MISQPNFMNDFVMKIAFFTGTGDVSAPPSTMKFQPNFMTMKFHEVP